MTELRLRLALLAAVSGAALCLALFGTATAQIQLTCFGSTPTIVRGNGNDVVTGTLGNDVI